MAGLNDAEIRSAEARGREMLATEPRASAAYFDADNHRLVLELMNGCTFLVPTALIQDLQGASNEALADVKVDSLGFNLHWPALQVDLDVPALVSGIFGTRHWMTRELARRAGQARSPAKASAARANGAKGGRPRKASQA
jgi:hypothetical protein